MRCLLTRKQRARVDASTTACGVDTHAVNTHSLTSPISSVIPDEGAHGASLGDWLRSPAPNRGDPLPAALTDGQEVGLWGLQVAESSDSELSDDEGDLIMRSPNPYADARRRRATDADSGPDGSFIPSRLSREALHRFLAAELHRRDPSPVRSSTPAEDAPSDVPPPPPEAFASVLTKALNSRVPEYRHLRLAGERDADRPFTPRTEALIALARRERLTDEWRRQQALVAAELSDGATLLSIQRPSYVDYCRCVRVMQHYSCGLPRWRGVISADSGDPCFVPPLFLADAPRGAGWRFYNCAISLSVATKIVARKEALRSRALSPTGMLPSPPSSPTQSPRGGLSGFHSPSVIASPPDAEASPAAVRAGIDSDPSIDLVDVMRNLYPLFPMGPLKVAVAAWERQLRQETDARCRTRLEVLPPEDTIKAAGIFHSLVAAGGGRGGGSRVDRETFVAHMPRGDRNVTAQLAAFGRMFDQHCRVEITVSDGNRTASRVAQRRRRSRAAVGRNSISGLTNSSGTTPASQPLPRMRASIGGGGGGPRSLSLPLDTSVAGASGNSREGSVAQGLSVCRSPAAVSIALPVDAASALPLDAASSPSHVVGAATEVGTCSGPPTGGEPFMDLECLANALFGSET